MDNKTIAIVSYITLIGWIVALVTYNGNPEKGSLARFHLRQSFGIMATGFALYIAFFIMAFILPFLIFLSFAVWIVIVVLWVLGLIAAANGEEKPVPVLGEMYQKWFTFIG